MADKQGLAATGSTAKDMIQRRTQQIALIQDARGLGTGLVVGADGWILTNKHVAPSVGPFRVILADGRDVHGAGVHQCPHSDLAVVKIAVQDLDAFDLETAVAEDLHVGEEVYALGHPRGCRFSVARGILSNPHREIEKEYFVQADVNINPGNSGGPLVDKEGLLVGIVSGTLSNSQGLGLAVPGYVAADYVRQVRRLVRYGIVKIPEGILAKSESERPAAEMVVRDAVGALVQAGKAAIKADSPDQGHIQLENRNTRVDIRCRDGLFTVSGLVMAMGSAERGNAKLLARILELNGTRELGGASFFLYEEAMYIGQMRPTAGLDPVEALWAIDQVLHLVGLWSQKLATLVYEVGTAWTPAPYGAPAPNPPYSGPPAAAPPGNVFPGQTNPGPYGPPGHFPYGPPPNPGAGVPGAAFGAPPAGMPHGQPPAQSGPYGLPAAGAPLPQYPAGSPYGPPPAQPHQTQPPTTGPYGIPPSAPPADPGYPILTLPTPDPRFR